MADMQVEAVALEVLYDIPKVLQVEAAAFEVLYDIPLAVQIEAVALEVLYLPAANRLQRGFGVVAN